MARNHCLDLLRRRKRLGKALVTLGPEDVRRTDMETAVADRDFVGIVFKQLSRRERQALWQSAVESRLLADIASGLRLSYMAAAQVLHRARRHAVQAAARVEVALGIFHLGRQRPGAGLLVGAQRLAAVPLIVISMNASSPVPQAASTSAAPAAVPTGWAKTDGGGLATVPIGEGRGGGGELVPGSRATLNSATDTLGEPLRSLPSVPPVTVKPATSPSVPALPSPPSIPRVP